MTFTLTTGIEHDVEDDWPDPFKSAAIVGVSLLLELIQHAGIGVTVTIDGESRRFDVLGDDATLLRPWARREPSSGASRMTRLARLWPKSPPLAMIPAYARSRFRSRTSTTTPTQSRSTSKPTANCGSPPSENAERDFLVTLLDASSGGVSKDDLIQAIESIDEHINVVKIEEN